MAMHTLNKNPLHLKNCVIYKSALTFNVLTFKGL